MGLLSDDFCDTVWTDIEKQGKTAYVEQWTSKHDVESSIPENLYTIITDRIGRSWRWSSSGAYLEPVKSEDIRGCEYKIYIVNKPITISSLSAWIYGDNDPTVWVNSHGKIIFKPNPQKQYLISNITDEDLEKFDIRTRHKQATTIYCYNCSPNIVSKNKKFNYKFVEVFNNQFVITNEFIGSKRCK